MTIEQLWSEFLKMKEDITSNRESTKQAHIRINENDDITKGIYDLASNVKALTVELQNLAKSMEKSLQAVEIRMQAFEVHLKELDVKIRNLENKPAKKWDAIAEKVLLLVVGAMVAFMLSKIGL